MKNVKVWNRARGSWVKIDTENNDVLHVSEAEADTFSYPLLLSARHAYDAFMSRPSNYIAVPIGGNRIPIEECNTVDAWLKEQREAWNDLP